MTRSERTEDGLTVILVHGAFADASSWSGVVAQLQAAGLDVWAVANPLRGPAADARHVADLAAELPGRVVELSIDRSQFPAVFAADVPAPAAAVMAASQRPIALAGFTEAAGEPAWRVLPSWYLVAADDQAIHVDAQRFMAQRAGSHIAETAGSHAVMVSQPAAVADVILTAAHTLR